jgi:hypothetical protein
MVIVDRSERTRKTIALLTFTAGGRPSQRLSCIGVRGFFSSPLVVVGKRLKLARNPSVSHVLGSAEQSPRRFQVLLANHIASTITQLENGCGHIRAAATSQDGEVSRT